jgi:hypothetical protein
MVPAAVPSGILLFAVLALVFGIFCPFLGGGVQNRSRTVFTSGEMFVKILQTTRIIVTQLAYEGFLGIFGDFWVQIVIVTILVRIHAMQMENGGKL